jgi:hypothetical protein
LYEALTALYFHAFFQWCLNEDGVANVDERFWQELADTHAAFYNHNNAVDLSKLYILCLFPESHLVGSSYSLSKLVST